MSDSKRSSGDSVVRFVWPVLDEGYRWSRDDWQLCMAGRDTPPAISAAPLGPWLIDPLASGSAPGHRTYPLRQRHDLHVEFARLPVADDDASLAAIAAFASRHGLLGHQVQSVRPVDLEGSDRVVHWAEHVMTWKQSIRQIGGLLKLVEACKRDDTELLRRYVHWHPSGRGVRLNYTWPGDSVPVKTWIARDTGLPDAGELVELTKWSKSTSDRTRYLAPVEYYLYREINELLSKHVAPRLPLGGGIALVPDSLFGIMVVMLAEQLSGVWQMNLCPACGQLFVPRSRRDQKTCSTACRKRLSRERGKS